MTPDELSISEAAERTGLTRHTLLPPYIWSRLTPSFRGIMEWRALAERSVGICELAQ